MSSVINGKLGEEGGKLGGRPKLPRCRICGRKLVSAERKTCANKAQCAKAANVGKL